MNLRPTNPAQQKTHPSLTLLVLVFLGLLAAGPARGQSGSPADGAALETLLDETSPLAFWRWIAWEGQTEGGEESCPPVPAAPAWEVSRLFEMINISPEIPPGLRGFCLYQHPGAPTEQELLALLELERDGLVERIAPDAMAVTVAGNPSMIDVSLDTLEAHFFDQAGRIDMEIVHPDLKPTLTVVDALQTSDDPLSVVEPGPGHGYSMLNIASRLLCDAEGGNCAAHIRSRLALLYDSFSPLDYEGSQVVPVVGGHFGLVSDLATAIRREVTTLNQRTPRTNGILNLSLGWNRLKVGGVAGTAVEAVYRALGVASCHGYLVIAAAGNSGFGPDEKFSKQPTYPAAWERDLAPSTEECADLLGDPDFDDPRGRLPLVIAAGGVQADGNLLDNARALPATLQAFADNVVVRDPDGNATAVQTGSSVAAVVVSAAAAAAWEALPEAPTGEVMRHVLQSGRGLGEPAGFCLNEATECPQIREVTLCEARHSACGEGSCEDLPMVCGPEVEGPVHLDADFEWFDRILDSDDLDMEVVPEKCGGRIVYYSDEIWDLGPEGPSNPCPHLEYHGFDVQPWTVTDVTGPQPGTSICRPCIAVPIGSTTSTNEGTLFIEVDPDLQGEIESVTIQVGLDLFSLENITLQAGDSFQVDNLPIDPGDAVLVSAVVDGELSSTSPALVVN